MRNNKARQLMRTARKSEKQMRRFLAQQSAGLSEDESRAFAADALAHAGTQHGEILNEENFATKVGLGLIKIGNRKH